MEHAYQAPGGINHFLLRVDRLLRKHGKWYKHRLVWAGDSAPRDPSCPVLPNGEEARNLFEFVGYSTTENYDGDRMMPTNDPTSDRHETYVVNHDTKEFVDTSKLAFTNKEKSLKVHPLPLLTSNNGGYYGLDSDKVGRWSGHRISIEDQPPSATAGFVELIVKFNREG